MPKVCVVGSINLDIVTKVDKYPERGQTVFGESIDEFHGGKGANQAVACAQLENEVAMIGNVGDDSNGVDLVKNLTNSGVNTSHIKKLEKTNSGQTTIILDGEAENVIIYVGGANTKLDPEFVANSIRELKNSEILLTQMESPHEAVLEGMKVAQEEGKLVILDPAPPNNVTDDMLQYVDIILPNTHETEFLTSIKVVDEQTAREAATVFQAKGVTSGVLTLGDEGSYVFIDDRITYIEGIEVKAIDTVGAGDCFAGALASALLDGIDLVEAAKYANLVAALKVTKSGAQIGMPTLQEVLKFNNSKNIAIYLK